MNEKQNTIRNHNLKILLVGEIHTHTHVHIHQPWLNLLSSRTELVVVMATTASRFYCCCNVLYRVVEERLPQGRGWLARAEGCGARWIDPQRGFLAPLVPS